MIKDKNEQWELFKPWVDKYCSTTLSREDSVSKEQNDFFEEIEKGEIYKETFEAHIKSVRISDAAKWDEYEAIWREILGF